MLKFLTSFIIVVAFIVGFALGALSRPNHIVFRIKDSRKILLLPRQGDIIDWVGDGTETPNMATVSVAFSGPAPCKGASAVEGEQFIRCQFQVQPSDPKHFDYHCIDSPGIAGACLDPGWEPRSVTHPVLDGLNAFFVRLLGKVALSFVPGDNSSTSRPVSPKSTVQERIASNDTFPTILCDANGNPQILPDAATGTYSPDITAFIGGSAYWDGGRDFRFTLDPATCDPPTSNVINHVGGGKATQCKIAANAPSSQTVSVSIACPKATSIAMTLRAKQN